MSSAQYGAQPRLRADAQLNHDRLLDVAARHFAVDGSDASMKAIAQEAGVGIGTLYRRFASREILIEATYRSESARLCASAYDLLHELPPVDALRTWMLQFLDYMATKRGMADALKVILTADEPLRLTTRTMIIDSAAMLLRAGAIAHVVRENCDPTTLVMALGGFAMIVGDEPTPTLREDLVTLLLQGLTTDHT